MNRLTYYSIIGLTLASIVALVPSEETNPPAEAKPAIAHRVVDGVPIPASRPVVAEAAAPKQKPKDVTWATIMTRDCIMDVFAAQQGILIGRTADQMQTYWKQTGQYNEVKETSYQLGFVMATMVQGKGYTIQQVYDSNSNSIWKAATKACYSKASFQR